MIEERFSPYKNLFEIDRQKEFDYDQLQVIIVAL